MTTKTTFKILGGVATAIILGAIGSGIWECLLSPGLDWIFRSSVDLFSAYSLNYKDSIYESAAKGFHENYSFRTFAIASLLLALYLMVSSMLMHDRIGHRFKQHYLAHKSKLQWFAMVASFSFSLFIMYTIGRHETVNNITTYSTQSLEIIRPYVDEKKYHLLKSTYFQIKSAAQFEKFNSSLQKEAKASNVTLPYYDPL